MKLLLSRFAFKPYYTIGKLSINGSYFCDTLELPSRFAVGIPKGAKTCIPVGSYRIILSVSPKFGHLLPRLLNVPNNEGILIHAGNSVADTKGCILVGLNTEIGRLTHSDATLQKILRCMNYAVTRHEPIFIDII